MAVGGKGCRRGVGREGEMEEAGEGREKRNREKAAQFRTESVVSLSKSSSCWKHHLWIHDLTK